MPIDNGNATTFVPDSPGAAGLASLSTTPVVDPRSLSLLQPPPPQNSPFNATMAGTQSDAIAKSGGRPGDWARGILAGAYKSMAKLPDLMAGFGSQADNTVPTGGTFGAEGKVPAGSGAVYGAGAGARAAQQMKMDILKANLLKSREHALLDQEDRAKKQEVVGQEQDMVKNGNMEEIQAGIAEKDLPAGWQQANLDPHKTHYFATGLDEKGNFLYGAYKVNSINTSDSDIALLKKYGTGDFSDVKPGQSLSGPDANRWIAEVAAARANQAAQDKVSLLEDEDKAAKMEISQKEAIAPAKKKFATYVDPHDPNSVIDAWDRMQEAAANGDKDAQDAVANLPMDADKIAQYQTQREDSIETARARIAAGQATPTDLRVLQWQLNGAQRAMGTAQTNLNRLLGIQAQISAKNTPSGVVQALLQQNGFKDAADLNSQIEQETQDYNQAKTNFDDYNESLTNYRKQRGVAPPPTPSNKPSPQTHNFSISAWKKANPKGDPAKAKAAAAAQGYKVIP